jgi:hypothetical protein
VNRIALHVVQAEVAASELVRQPLVVDAQFLPLNVVVANCVQLLPNLCISLLW